MTAFEVRRTINESPDAVWACLTDGAALQDGGLGITKSIPGLQPSFEQFADGLRRLAERGAR